MAGHLTQNQIHNTLQISENIDLLIILVHLSLIIFESGRMPNAKCQVGPILSCILT